MEKMTRKQICFFLVLGICLTILVSCFPVFADRYVVGQLGVNMLYDENELVEFLKAEQGKGVYIGLHGYNHVCPICGSTTHELSCPNGTIPLEELERRITEGLQIFEKSGLQADWYAFPGEVYDERCIDFLENKGFYILPYRMGGEIREMPVNHSMLDFTFSYPFREYTWGWRDGVSAEILDSTLERIRNDSSIQILMHIQDFTPQTKELLTYAVSCGVTIIRCDDITSDRDLQNVRELAEFAEDHNVSLLLAVIPTFGIQSSSLNIYTSATWYMFLASFVFPVMVTVPWAIYFKLKRKIKPLKGNPHFPSVSLILPAYNEEKIIGKSIEHGLDQDYEGDMEIIVVNDGSTDRTAQIVEEYTKRHPNVRLINHRTRTCSSVPGRQPR
jgi:peptidoglycan/xylan/chitin deacetylase (PgdA/CDA1 family)